MVKKVAGAAYVVLLAVFAVRLLSKRANSATEEVGSCLFCTEAAVNSPPSNVAYFY